MKSLRIGRHLNMGTFLLGDATFGRTGVAGTPLPPASPFLASAQKVLSVANAKRTVTADALSIDITNTGNSLINGRTLAQGGIVSNSLVPNGLAPPLDPGVKWIVTKTPVNQTSSNLGYAPGQSKLFRFTGQRFDFKGSVAAGKSFSIRWSTDDGLTWKHHGPIVLTQACWCLIDFGSVANRVVEVIGEDEQFQIYGFNFDTGNAAPAAFDTSPFPKGMMLGDSYVFGQGSRQDGVVNGQQATLGMARKAAEFIGWPQIYGHGFRTNGFAQTQGGVQSRFADRIKLPTDDSLSEGSVWGALDYVIIPGSINDASGAYASTRLADTTLAFQNIREKQPNALIVFPIGANAPQLTEGSIWINDYKDAFTSVFGSTQAQQIANGALLVDGTRLSGEAWVPAGALGSSAYFPGSGDVAHPLPAGHAFFGQRYGQGVIDLATAIVAAVGGGGGSPASTRLLLEDGGSILLEDNSYLIQE